MSDTTCTPRCWTPIPCPECGQSLPPRGRDIPLAMNLPQCCEEAVSTPYNTRHLWSEHDSTRYYTDPEGWEEHVAGCEKCRPEGD